MRIKIIYQSQSVFQNEIQNQKQILIFKERYSDVNEIDMQLSDLIEATLLKNENELIFRQQGMEATINRI